jgi:methyl-accepting chemotaxis protein
MLKNANLATRIITSFMIVVALVAITGAMGLFSINTVSTSLRIVGDEEAPLVDTAMEMKLNLMHTLNIMEEFKAATSVLSSEDDSIVDELEEKYEAAVEEFDFFVGAALDGATLEGGHVVIGTDNDELAGLVRSSDNVHNSDFQTAAKAMIKSGHEMIAIKKETEEEMVAMEAEFDEIYADAAIVEEMVTDEVQSRIRSANIAGEALSIIREEMPLQDMVNEIKISLAESRIVLEEFVQALTIAKLDELEEEYDATIAVFDRNVNAMLNGGVVGDVTVIASDNDAIRAAIEEIDADHTIFQEVAEQMMAAQRSLVTKAIENNELMAKLDHAGEKAAELINQAEEIASGEMQAAKVAGAAAVNFSFVSLISTVLISIALGLFLGITITRSITLPINEIIVRLREGSEQLFSSSNQVSSSSEQLAQSSSEQASSLEEVSSSLEEMAAMAASTTDNTATADNLSKEAGVLTEDGTVAMDKLLGAIEKIKNSSDETAKIIKTIDEIAFQTNLLALNAAVEAARAGEAGKGFAVVAEEVRNLAQRSAEAAKGTAELISQSISNAEEGVAISNDVSSYLGRIKTSVHEVTSLVHEVNQGSLQQSEGIGQISTAVLQMDKTTQSNAASSEETAGSSQELTAQAHDVSTIVENLADLIRGANRVKKHSVPSTGSLSQAATSRPALSSRATAPTRQATAMNPDSIIPMDDDDFSDF